jgi:hypothetical protein
VSAAVAVAAAALCSDLILNRTQSRTVLLAVTVFTVQAILDCHYPAWTRGLKRRVTVQNRQIRALAIVYTAFAAGCTTPWTARVCSSNDSGNCRGVDNQEHTHTLKSAGGGPVTGLTDVEVHEPACGSNGMGAVDVQVVDDDELFVTIHCLVDKPSGTIALPEAAAAASPSPSPPSPAWEERHEQ